MFKRIAVALIATAVLAPSVHAETYEIDPRHSYVGFSVSHMTISRVKGRFTDFSGTIVYDPADTSSWSLDITIKTTSVDTRDEDRDNHLRSEDFFNTAEWPDMTFKSTKIIPGKDDSFSVLGDLMIKGVVKSVTLEAELLGAITDPSGNQRAGFTARTTINRLDYDIKWSQTMEAGGLMLGHDVEIILEVEAVKAKEETEEEKDASDE